MTYQEFYGDQFELLEAVRKDLLQILEQFPDNQKSGFHAIQYTCSRIKSPESMIEKLKRKGLPVTQDSALGSVHDAVGVRVICSFADDIFQVKKWLKSQDNYELIREKDYISYPKQNGYRGIHLILRAKSGSCAGIYAEIQLRTIAMDFWASLEHKLRYKKEIPESEKDSLQKELFECAQMINTLDQRMEAVKNRLVEGGQWEKS